MFLSLFVQIMLKFLVIRNYKIIRGNNREHFQIKSILPHKRNSGLLCGNIRVSRAESTVFSPIKDIPTIMPTVINYRAIINALWRFAGLKLIDTCRYCVCNKEMLLMKNLPRLMNLYYTYKFS